MPVELLQLHRLWGPPLIPATGPCPPLDVSTDSRALRPGGLFLPLVGERFDGHAFLQPALAAGSRALVVQRNRLPTDTLRALTEAAISAGAALWLVEDTLQAYQDLAHLWRQGLAAPVVAVTGSAGKTSTRELIRAVLAPLGPVLASSGNENNDVGVPLTLLKATAEHRAVVVEMGMRGPGEIERLTRCASPDVAVITNIGTAHIGRLGSREAIAGAKCEIVAGLDPAGLVVIPAGDPLLDRSLAPVWSGRVVRVALAGDPGEDEADCLGVLDAAAASLAVDGVTLPLPLAGRHQARNLLLALSVARELGLAPTDWSASAVELPGGRSRTIQLGGVQLLDETYNASPEAVLASLELLAGRSARRRYAVLGTMLELGERSVDLHRQVARHAQELGLDGLVLVVQGDEGAAMEESAARLPRLARVETPEQAAACLAGWLEPGDAVLLKASRGVALERVIEPLERRLSPGDRASSP